MVLTVFGNHHFHHVARAGFTRYLVLPPATSDNICPTTSIQPDLRWGLNNHQHHFAVCLSYAIPQIERGNLEPEYRQLFPRPKTSLCSPLKRIKALKHQGLNLGPYIMHKGAGFAITVGIPVMRGYGTGVRSLVHGPLLE